MCRSGTPTVHKTNGPEQAPAHEVSQMKERSDRLLQLLRSAEGDLLRSLDLDGFAGRRVAAHAGGALAHDEDAQTVETDAGALLQVLRDQPDGVLEDRIRGL